MEATTTPAPGNSAEDHPGRWFGGLVGALASLAVGAAAVALTVASGGTEIETIVLIAVLGMPVGFVLGRAALPMARSGDWTNALGMGLLIGFAAPILGALEIVLGAGAIDGALDSGGCTMPPLFASLFLMLWALPVSFLASILTVPAGIAWAITVRHLPEAWLSAARMPAPISALGVRHVALVLLVVLLVVGVIQIATSASCG